MNQLIEHPLPFGVYSAVLGRVEHLHLSGELDMATVPVLEKFLEDAQGKGRTGIVLNLKLLTFMDASGLNSFLRAAKQAAQNGQDFQLINPGSVAQRILKITRTGYLLEQNLTSPPNGAIRLIDATF